MDDIVIEELPGQLFDSAKEAAGKLQSKLVEVGGHFRNGNWVPQHFRTFPDADVGNNLGSHGLGNKIYED